MSVSDRCRGGGFWYILLQRNKFEMAGSPGEQKTLCFRLFREATQLKTAAAVGCRLRVKTCHEKVYTRSQIAVLSKEARQGPAITAVSDKYHYSITVFAAARGGVCQAGASVAENEHREVAGLRRG